MLSILKNAGRGSITYYVGNNPSHISHLNDCKLICKQEFEGLDNVEQIVVDKPQLHFYKLSHKAKNNFIFSDDGYSFGEDCEIHKSAVIGLGVTIGNNVNIGPNSVIYSNTEIGDNVQIGANCTIGAEGMMWVWDDDVKVFLKQLGGVKIGNDCIVGSNSSIVRGSANELTILEDGVNMASGCCIGHGTFIGKQTHLANNVSTGGSSYISEYCFIGSSAVVSPGVVIGSTDVTLGSGGVMAKSIEESGVYVGIPAKLLKKTDGNLRGVPKLRKYN
jgi:UDP-3-O-[3-hydroxymyristoyl] glucosamine N-acyltransferase|tara:strand:- start:383 stop:1207 length:825 start_codon:yes stop_codon:yes gene_type:complete